MTQPIVYREVLARGRRTFELFEDRVVVRIRYPNQSAEITVPLASLRPTPNTIRLREWPFHVGICLIGVPWVVHGVRWGLAGRVPSSDALIFAVSIGIVGAVLCLYSLRKIEFASFVTHAGPPALDIGDAGPDRAAYRTFVDTLIDRIRAAQGSAA